MKTLVAALVLSLSAVPAFGQILPLGISSDSVVALMAGRATYSDSTLTNPKAPRPVEIRFAPISFHGIHRGVLITVYDRKGRLESYNWIRFPTFLVAGEYITHDDEAPTLEDFDAILEELIQELGKPSKRDKDKHGRWAMHDGRPAREPSCSCYLETRCRSTTVASNAFPAASFIHNRQGQT